MVYDALMNDLDPPQPGEYLAYDFNEDDTFTLTNICHLNGLKLEEILRLKVLKCKQQDRSNAHPKWGPFCLAPVDSSTETYQIMNGKGKKALTFHPAEFSLDTEGIPFDTSDTYTYTLL